MTYRIDAALGAVASRVDENGYFRAKGTVAKVGVYEYVNADGTIRTEFVPPETLADAAANMTLAGVPVTVGHPQEGRVTSSTAQIYSKGAVIGVPHFDGEELITEISITHADAINRMDQQKIYQLSPGYDCQIEYKPGTYKGKRYDFIQVKRIYNHLAAVTDARGGKDCRLRLDGRDYAIAVGIDHINNDSIEGKQMATVTLPNGVTVEVGDAATANTIQTAFRADADDKAALKLKLDEAKKAVDELQGKYDALDESTKDDQKKSDADEEAIAARADSLLVTLESARKLKSDIDMRTDGKLKSTRELMCEALGMDLKSAKSDDYIAARFDAAIEQVSKKTSTENVARQRRVDHNGKVVLSAVEQHRAAFYGGKA